MAGLWSRFIAKRKAPPARAFIAIVILQTKPSVDISLSLVKLSAGMKGAKMKNFKLLTGLAATVAPVLVAGVSLAAEPAKFAYDGAPPAPCTLAPKPPKDVRDQAGLANVYPVIRINMLTREKSPTIDDFNCPMAQLRYQYQLRAGRSRGYLAGSSDVVAGSSFMAIASRGAGVATQTYWGLGALTPVVVAQFNAHEPMRDLHLAGVAGLDLIYGRYLEFDDESTRFAEQVGELTPEPSQLCSDAYKTPSAYDGLLGADRGVLFSEARRVVLACAANQEKIAMLKLFLKDIEVRRLQAPRRMGQDVLDLDRAVQEQAAKLKYTPLETFSAIAASPFLTAGSVLSSQDVKGAADAFKAQRTLSALDKQLMDFRVSAPPGPLTPLSLPADTIWALEDVPKKGQKPSISTAISAAHKVLSHTADVNRETAKINAAIASAKRLSEIAAPAKLEFRVDPGLKTVKVLLSPVATTSPTP